MATKKAAKKPVKAPVEPEPEVPKAMAAVAIPHFEPERPKLNFDIDPDSYRDLVPIANVAWNAVKGHDDASFGQCVPHFQRKLLEHARSALKTGAQAGDTNLARFEQEVSRLREQSIQGD